jgi:hypothetical protein
MTEDNDEDWGIRFVEHDEGFSFEDVSTEEREKVTCYYKFFRGKPDPEFDERCKTCEGFPYKEGCTKYTTREHIETFYKKHSLINSDIQVREVPTGLEDFEQGGGFIPIISRNLEGGLGD